MAAGERQIVREFIASRGRETRQKDLPPEETITFDVQTGTTRIVGVHIELIPIPLETRFVLRARAELMEPSDLRRTIP
jgi:hypothetical protein